MFCSKCGKELQDGSNYCPRCGAVIREQSSAAAHKSNFVVSAFLLKLPLWLKITVPCGIAILIVIIILLSNSGKYCAVSGCRNKKEYGDYCVSHVCLYGTCTNRRMSGSDYCSLHSGSTSSNSGYSGNVYQDLVFSNIKIEHNSLYTVATGSVRNEGSRTYRFVQVKGAFSSSLTNRVLDTDWTYAVGSEGLAPGESTTFRLSVSMNTAIDDCDISIIDYD